MQGLKVIPRTLADDVMILVCEDDIHNEIEHGGHDGKADIGSHLGPQHDQGETGRETEVGATPSEHNHGRQRNGGHDGKTDIGSHLGPLYDHDNTDIGSHTRDVAHSGQGNLAETDIGDETPMPKSTGADADIGRH